jgi:hypothetical protein
MESGSVIQNLWIRIQEANQFRIHRIWIRYTLGKLKLTLSCFLCRAQTRSCSYENQVIFA